MTTTDRIIKIIADHLVIDADDLSAETLLAELDMDSLDAVEICMEINDEFEIDLEQYDRCKTIGDIVAQVETLLEI